METQYVHAPYELEYVEVTDGAIHPHIHTFFEIVYVLEGTGVQWVNDLKLSYGPQKMFLLMPQDRHSFDIHTSTTLFFIRFHDIYLRMQDKGWLQKLEYIFHHHNHLPGCILHHQPDKMLVKPLIEALVREHVNRHLYHQELVSQMINTLITLTARNISFMLGAELHTQDFTGKQTAQQLLHYIHLHIYQPEALKASVIAERFHVSPFYISEYFKKLTGQSLQTYIMKYKVGLVESRLRYSDLRVNEIANEMGFTDESHLNRLFKKYRGLSPSAFRNQCLDTPAR